MTQDKDYDPTNDENQDEERVIKWHLSFLDEVINSKTIPSKSNDPGCKYGYMVNQANQNNANCMLCSYLFKGGIGWLKDHLTGGDKTCTKCTNVPKFISKEISEYVAKKKGGVNKVN